MGEALAARHKLALITALAGQRGRLPSCCEVGILKIESAWNHLASAPCLRLDILHVSLSKKVCQLPFKTVLRVHDLSGSVALSGRQSAPKGVRDETDASATRDTEDEIRGSV